MNEELHYTITIDRCPGHELERPIDFQIPEGNNLYGEERKAYARRVVADATVRLEDWLRGVEAKA